MKKYTKLYYKEVGKLWLYLEIIAWLYFVISFIIMDYDSLLGILSIAVTSCMIGMTSSRYAMWYYMYKKYVETKEESTK